MEDILELFARLVLALESIADSLAGRGDIQDEEPPADDPPADDPPADDPPKKETAPAKKKRLAAEKKKKDAEADEPTKDTVRAALGKVQEEISSDVAKGILGDFGVNSIGKLVESDYGDVIKACNEKIAENDE